MQTMTGNEGEDRGESGEDLPGRDVGGTGISITSDYGLHEAGR